MLEELIGTLEKRKTQHVETYRELVGKLARSRKVKPDDVEAVLSAAGKSPAELKRDVEALVERIALAERIAHRPDLEREQSAIQKQIATADAELTKAEELHGEKVMPLVGRGQEIAQELRAIEQARGRLLTTAPVHLREQAAVIEAEAKKAVQHAQDVNRRIEIVGKNVRDLKAAIAKTDWQPFQVEYTASLKREEERLQELTSELAALNATIHDDLASKRAAVYKAMLTP